MKLTFEREPKNSRDESKPTERLLLISFLNSRRLKKIVRHCNLLILNAFNLLGGKAGFCNQFIKRIAVMVEFAG